MNILVLGDSYGVPNYYGPPGDPAETHITHLLSEHYNVYNVSRNGGSNLFTIDNAYKLLKTGSAPQPADHPDCPAPTIPPNTIFHLILWFHTAILRDHLDDVPVNAVKKIQELSEKTYDEIAKLKEKLACPLIAVGGAGAILSNIHNHITPDIMITDWKSDLIKEPLPAIQTLGRSGIFDVMTDGLDVKERIVSEHFYVFQKLGASDQFPDNAHPGAEAHQALYELVRNFIESSKIDK